jgi:spore germination protein YaaH
VRGGGVEVADGVGVVADQELRTQMVIGLPSYGYSAPAACDTDEITGNIPNVTMQTMPGYSSKPATVAARRDPGSGEIRWVSGGTLYDYVDSTAMDAKLSLLERLGVTKVSVWSLGGNPWFSSPN